MFICCLLQVYPQNIPDISAGCITCMFGRYKGKLPSSVKVKGCQADMNAIEINLKVEHAKDMKLEKVNILLLLVYPCVIVNYTDKYLNRNPNCIITLSSYFTRYLQKNISTF
jgi:hypothetical protein